MDHELEGSWAFVDGVGFDQCPHKEGSQAGVEWASGWMLAERGEFRWQHRDSGRIPHHTAKASTARQPESVPEVEVPLLHAPEPAPTVDLAAENEALRQRIAELETIPEPEPEPETHFADLMLADETADDARVRLSQRLRELRHYLIAPEIKVNEDGSVGLTASDQAELQDLERRQTLGRWLDA